jgi:serine/threonine protein kinase
MIEEEKIEKIRELFRLHQNGRFTVEKVLGVGGMGIVVRAFDTRLKVARAIKIFNPELLAHERLVRRFQNEASIMAGIDHPNIVKVYDIGEVERHHFIVLEWIDGGSLAGFLDRSGFMHPQVALQMIYCVCDALSVAHKRGIIHRDIKPDNILINTDGIPKVTDFGIAHMEETEKKRLTATREAMGSPGYMAPEQMSDLASADARADVYSVAVTLWALVTALHPPGLLFFHDLEESPELLNNVPVCLHEILKKAVAYKPADRYQSIAEFTLALKAIEQELPAFVGSEMSVVRFDEDGYAPEPTAIGATKIASLTEKSSDPVTDQPTGSSLLPPMMMGGTLAYRPSGEVAEVPLLENVPVIVTESSAKESVESVVSKQTEKHHRSYLRIALFVTGLGCVIGFIGMKLWSSQNTPEFKEEKNLIVTSLQTDTQSVFQLPVIDAGSGAPALDVSIMEDVSPVEISEKVTGVTEATEAGKAGKENKVMKPIRPMSAKSDETPVIKQGKKKEKSLQVPDPIVSKPEVVKVQVGLDLPSDDTSKVWLVGSGGKHKLPGSVVPGTYKVVAAFKDQEGEMTVMSALEIKEGSSIRLSCNAAFMKCRKL